MNSRRVVTVTRWTLAFAALAGIVLVYRRWLPVNSTTVALTLLLLILVLAAEWGLRYAVVISIAATACYNFFFLPPVGTFTISDPQNWLALFAFLATAMIASRLSQRARDETEDARYKQHELEVMFHLSREILQTDSPAALMTAIPFSVVSATAARVGILYLLEGDRLYRAGIDEVSEIEIPHLRQLAMTLTGISSDPEEMQIPLRSGVRPRGLLVLRGASLSTKTAEAIGGLISVAMDRAQALENVAKNEGAKEIERLRTLMIDSITHELRTPLTSIKGAATTLLGGNVGVENSRELITIIDEESDRLNRLVSEAVEMAQLDAQQVKMHFTRVNVLELVKRAMETCAWVEDEHTLVMHVPEELSIRADPDLLQKVICNLVENAAKYSQAGTPITISAERRGRFDIVSVADRGIGIDPSEQGLIFERFYRARTYGMDSYGTGMGLAISRSIIEAHGGTITLASQPGRGSVFTCELPADEDSVG
jgi:two-component system, OmpR family, sensor histidine kinase KdpD